MHKRYSFGRAFWVATITATTVFLILGEPSARADSAEAWGYNLYGQLGNGSTTNSKTPVAVNGMTDGVAAIAGGEFHSLAIQNGGAYAWGNNGSGQLGNGSTTNSATPLMVTGMGSGVTAIAGGGFHSLAIQNGGVYAWGYGGDGELGNGSTTTSSTPVAVSGMGSSVTAIAAGFEHSLAIQNGGVFSWGRNDSGQLGNGSTTNSTTPVPVSGLSSGVTAIAAGDTHSLAIQNGAVFAWGANDSGQLGNPSIFTVSTTPVAVTGLSSGVTAIAAGFEHSLAIQNGVVYAWGANTRGELGIPHIDPLESKTPVQVETADDIGHLTNIVAIAASDESSYALSSDGSLWVWGDNGKGELGLGTTQPFYEFAQHLLPPSGYVFTSIDAGANGFHVLANIAPVPEPTSLVTAGLAIGMIGCRRGIRPSS